MIGGASVVVDLAAAFQKVNCWLSGTGQFWLPAQGLACGGQLLLRINEV